MYSLGYAIDIILRVLNGECFRKATFDEKSNYASSLNLIALLAASYPWLMFSIEKYPQIVTWILVIRFLFPTVVLIYWNRESLPLIWNVLLSTCIIAVPIVFAILSILGIQLRYNRTISAIVFMSYLTVLFVRSCLYNTEVTLS